MSYHYRNLTKDELDVILIRYYNKTLLATQWDQMLGRRKHHNLPYSDKIMNILAVNDWEHVYEYSLNLLNDYCSTHNVTTDEVPKHIEKEYQKVIIRYELEPFLENVVSVRKYDEFRRNHSDLHLPNPQKIICNFGSWNLFREAMNLPINSTGNPVVYTDEKLLEILEEHKAFFTTNDVWEQHIKNHKSKTNESLPSMQWMKARIDREILLKYNHLLHRTEKEYIHVLQEHSHAFRNGVTYWTAYAQKYGLPGYKTIIRNLTDEQINEALNSD